MRNFYIIIASSIFLLDRVTKWVAAHKLRLREPVQIIPNLFNLTYEQNSGIAFGLFRESTWPWKHTALSLIAIVAIGMVIYYAQKLPRETKYVHFALALVLGGIVGNLYDRMLEGQVIDFLDLHWYHYHWPTFNVADSAITVSMILLIIFALRAP